MSVNSFRPAPGGGGGGEEGGGGGACVDWLPGGGDYGHLAGISPICRMEAQAPGWDRHPAEAFSPCVKSSAQPIPAGGLQGTGLGRKEPGTAAVSHLSTLPGLAGELQIRVEAPSQDACNEGEPTLQVRAEGLITQSLWLPLVLAAWVVDCQRQRCPGRASCCSEAAEQQRKGGRCSRDHAG